MGTTSENEQTWSVKAGLELGLRFGILDIVKKHMRRSIALLLLSGSLLALNSFAWPVYDPDEDVPLFRTVQTPEQPGLDSIANPVFYGSVSPKSFGPIAPASSQPSGVLSGRVVFMSGGHGWNWSGTSWALDRPSLAGMNEDTGNVDQMTMFAYQCFNAGATVVPMRPVGHSDDLSDREQGDVHDEEEGEQDEVDAHGPLDGRAPLQVIQRSQYPEHEERYNGEPEPGVPPWPYRQHQALGNDIHVGGAKAPAPQPEAIEGGDNRV